VIRLAAALLRAFGLLAPLPPRFVRFAVPVFYPRNPLETAMIALAKDKTSAAVPLLFFRDEDPRPAPAGGRVSVTPETAGTATMAPTSDAVFFTRGERAGRAVVRYTNDNFPDLVAELSIEIEAIVIEPPPEQPNRVVFDEANAVFA